MSVCHMAARTSTRQPRVWELVITCRRHATLPPLPRAPRAEWAVATRSLLFTVPIGTALHKDIVLLLMLSGRDLIL